MTALLPERTATVTDIRLPVWLNKADRVDLAEAILDVLQNTTVMPTTKTLLDAVLTELGVAEARDQIWPDKSQLVRKAYDFSADTLPIRMSEDERRAASSIPTLPAALRHHLTGSGVETKT